MPVTSIEIKNMFHYRDPFIHPSIMFRKSVFAGLGLYNTSFRTNQDTELWSRALEKDIGTANIPEALLYFRIGNMVKKRSNIARIFTEAKARYSFNTLSLILNFKKITCLLFRFMPKNVREWAYLKLR
jgi:hypothetical protein